MFCTYAPQGRTFKEYKEYLREIGNKPKVVEENVLENLAITQHLFKTTRLKVGVDPRSTKNPDEAYFFAMKTLNYIQPLLRADLRVLQQANSDAKIIRDMMKVCMDYAEVISKEGGPLAELHHQMLLKEQADSDNGVRDTLLKQQFEKGELSEDERMKAREDSLRTVEVVKKSEHEMNKMDTIGIRNALDEDYLSRMLPVLGGVVGGVPDKNKEDAFLRMQAKLAENPVFISPTPKPAQVPVNSPMESPPPHVAPPPPSSPHIARQPTPTIQGDFLAFPPVKYTTPVWSYQCLAPPKRSGLRNLGNTCFLNSVLQCLFSIRDFRQILVSQSSYLPDLLSGGNKGRVINCLSESFTNMDEMTNMDTMRGVVNPSNLKTVLGERNESFAGFSQQDASEFFLCLINEVHSDINKKTWILAPGSTSSVGNDLALATDSARRYFRLNSLNSIVPRTFMLQTRSLTQCLLCGNVSKVINTEFSLELPFPPSAQPYDVIDIQSLLREYCKVDKFHAAHPNDTNGYKCERCNKYTSANRQTTVFSLPRVLTLTLKRFKNYGNFQDKISSCVAFPEVLFLRPFCVSALGSGNLQNNFTSPSTSKIIHTLLQEHVSAAGLKMPQWQPKMPTDDASYRLIGIVNHRGNIHGGHYTADVRDDRNNWARISDEAVTTPDKADRALAYMLFYELA